MGGLQTSLSQRAHAKCPSRRARTKSDGRSDGRRKSSASSTPCARSRVPFLVVCKPMQTLERDELTKTIAWSRYGKNACVGKKANGAKQTACLALHPVAPDCTMSLYYYI